MPVDSRVKFTRNGIAYVDTDDIDISRHKEAIRRIMKKDKARHFADSAAAMRYLRTVDGQGHMSAVEIIMEQEDRIDVLTEALQDMLAGWRYLRETHGDLSGVGWDRAQTEAEEALHKSLGKVRLPRQA